MKMIFWGAGKYGKKVLAIFRMYGLEPEFFLDRKVSDKAQLCDGVIVHNPNWIRQKISCLSDYKVFITCMESTGVKEYLLNVGITEKQIVSFDSIGHVLDFAMTYGNCIFSKSTSLCPQMDEEIYFDLDNGMALGGVERWAVSTGRLLKEDGKKVYLLLNKNNYQLPREDCLENIEVFCYGDNDTVKLKKLIDYFLNRGNITIVCNFAGLLFAAAIIAKSCCDSIRIVAVTHCDDIGYYNSYNMMQEYIDRCLVISSQIKKGLCDYGVANDKLMMLGWYIPCDNTNSRKYSEQNETLNIGYAGRININPKRVDLILKLANELRQYNIRWNIAGVGDYLQEAIEYVARNDLQENVVFLGTIEEERIYDFWKQQDIMVSCSEREGHSISQCEAMANGVVPILTDVSGVRDDVESGVNGYVVNIGDIEEMKRLIIGFYENRASLKKMGNMAHKTIAGSRTREKYLRFWRDVLGYDAN